jgi:hypothetical protein
MKIEVGEWSCTNKSMHKNELERNCGEEIKLEKVKNKFQNSAPIRQGQECAGRWKCIGVARRSAHVSCRKATK